MTFNHLRQLQFCWILAGFILAKPIFNAAYANPSLNAASLQASRPQHDLLLVYQSQDDDSSRAIIPYLRDFAAVYGPEGLVVVVTGEPEEGIEPQIGCGDYDGQDDQDRIALVMCRRDGAVLAAMERAAIDLYAVYRICEGELRGRNRITLSDHVRQVIDGQITRGLWVSALDGGGGIPLADVLHKYPDGCLLLPPGCSDCILDKFAAALGYLFSEKPYIPVLTFEPEAVERLGRLGWIGMPYLLPTDAESRLLSLRQAGNYLPMLVAWSEKQGTEVRSIRTIGGI